MALDADYEPIAIAPALRQRLEQRSARLWKAAPHSARRHRAKGHRLAPKDESGKSWWCMDCCRWLGRSGSESPSQLTPAEDASSIPALKRIPALKE